MRLLFLIALTAHASALYMTALTNGLLETAPSVTIFDDAQPKPTASMSISITEPPSSIPFSALMTIAPLSPNPLELRQRCFNDQGFSVDCAQWTGYYYTWGGAGHPYAGGPGDGGGSNTGGVRTNGATTHIRVLKSSSWVSGLEWPVVAVLAALCLVTIF